MSLTRMADAIRILAMDAVEEAGCGHPGMPMGMADVATVLWTKYLKFDPSAPRWHDRDRFVLSAGHGSMLLYALLHLTGVEEVTLDQIRRFRKYGSITPGHPEYGHTPGVETTTGPLGQGLANAVGMAIAERHLAARFGEALVDHRTWVVAGDGCLMEGISHEAISLAGRLRLAKLTVLWDDNEVTIDGPVSLAETGDQLARWQAAGWETRRIDGHDHARIDEALAWAVRQDRPTMIACGTRIGKGAPNLEGRHEAHGKKLGAAEIAAARAKLDWAHDSFVVPDDIAMLWRAVGPRSRNLRNDWDKRLRASEHAAEFEQAVSGRIDPQAHAALDRFVAQALCDKLAAATREHSGAVLAAVFQNIPELVGGSADLTGSNNTYVRDTTILDTPDYSGRYINYGVREHAMAAAMNGMALHGGLIPYGGLFFVFTDYCRPAIRLSALMGVRVIYVATHDSIGVGEDGPTHQPVEQLLACRGIPNLHVFRPADAVETAECWRLALMATSTPSMMVLSRQKVPPVRTKVGEDLLSAKGAYELAPADGEARVTLFASGSEVFIAMAARERLQARGVPTRVVSTPCWDLFDAQPADYRESVIRRDTVRVAVEAAVGLGWERFIGEDGGFVGMRGFGASAPGEQLYEAFGITDEAVVEMVCSKLREHACAER